MDIAIVGLAGRFPASGDAEELWGNLVSGRDCIKRFTQQELAAGNVPAEVREHPDFVPVEPRIPDRDMLDAMLFGLTPQEARHTDPQIRLFIECSHAALENAGYDAFAAPGPVAVFGSAGPPDYLSEHLRRMPGTGDEGVLAILNCGDYMATEVAYRLNLTGPAMTVLTACSSSLIAAHLATRSLEAGECALAVAGGACVEVTSPFGYFYAEGGPRSKDGRVRALDVSRSGTVFGSGGGAVVLKRLADAVADGDHVYAVIRGSAVNNDGANKASFGAPSLTGQAACITAALETAGVLPSQLSYLEAHATGTATGDKVELSALERAWRSIEPEATLDCMVGSIKSNIGHPVQAAGVASLIKLAFAFDREILPPSINVDEPMPETLADGFSLTVVREPREWSRRTGADRLAAVSSFAVGGANAHMVLAEPPAAVPTARTGRDRVVVWSARTEAAADELAASLAGHLASTEVYEDAVSTLALGRTAFQVRRAAVLAGPDEAAVLASKVAERPVAWASIPAGGAAPVLAFPGQGSLVQGSLLGLSATEPLFAANLDAAFGLFSSQAERFAQLWRNARDATDIARTRNAQPILFALELALANTLRDWGMRPAAVTGHSLGELVAATVAGVFDPADAARAVLARSDAMQRMPEGAMIAVFADETAVARCLPAGLDICAVNGESETVVGGPRDEVAAFVGLLREDGIRAVALRTSHAFHTRAMAAAREEMLAVFDGVPRRRPQLPLISAAAGRQVDAEVLESAFWADQLVTPVRFVAAMDALAALGADDRGRRRRVVVVEAGPGQALTSLCRGHTSAREADLVAVPVTSRVRPGHPVAERRDLLTAVGTAWVNGVTVDWKAVDGDMPLRRVPVPGYHYQRQSYWVDAPFRTFNAPPGLGVDGEGGSRAGATAARPAVTTARAPESAANGLGGVVAIRDASATGYPAFAVPGWTETARPSARPQRVENTVVLLPPEREAGRRILVALHQIGEHVLPVRPGPGYELRERDAVLDPGDGAALERLLTELAARGWPPARIVHATGLQSWDPVTAHTVDDQVRLGFGSLLRLAKAISGKAPGTELIVLTTRAVDVSGSEPVDPVKAAALGLVRSWPLEDPSVRVRLIDADDRVVEEDLADEFQADSAEPVVALRGTRRWTSTELPLPVRPGHAQALRRKGTYLITGGLGGLGLELALGLARTGRQPSIAVLGRRAADDIPRFAEVSEAAADLGAQVKAVTADVADERDVRRALDIVTARLGPVCGVFHLAGVAGGGIVALRDPAAADAVLRPKVRGTVVLAEAFRDRPPLDFWVSFASRAGVTGLAGSADYAGANAFLDAYTAAAPEDGTRLHGTRLLSIDWPSWSGVGMAVPALAAEPLRRSGARIHPVRLDPGHAWVLNEHRLNGLPVLPGAGHIDLVIRAFRQAVDSSPGAVRLDDVVFSEALRAPGPIEAKVVFLPDGDGWTFEVQTGEPVRVHSSGSVRRVAADRPARADLEPLWEGLADATSARLAESTRMFALGPRWDCVDREASADDRTVVEIRLGERFSADLGEHPAHPALLDWATSAARLPGRGMLIPFMYGSITLYEDLPAHLITSVRRVRDAADTIVANMDLMAPDGRVLAEIRGFTMRLADPEAVGAVGEHAAARPPDAVPARGIPPKRGVELLLELLDARTPRQVLVRPFVDGRPELLTLAPSAGPVTAVPAPVTSGTGAVAAQPVGGADKSPLERMHAVWTEVLGAMEFQPDDDFFDIGGTSLSAIELVARIRAEFGTSISIAQLLDTPSLSGLAAVAAG